MQLVARGVEDAERERRRLALEGAHEQDGEHGVLRHVRALAQDQVPGRRGRCRGSGSTRARRSRPPRATTGSQMRERARAVTLTMLDSRSHKGERLGNAGASPGRSRRCEGRRFRAEHATGLRAGKAAREGAPSQKTCRSPPTRTPRGRRIRCYADCSPSSWRRSWSSPSAAAARVHVRVEGKTHTIFGATAPFVNVKANALDALEAASNAGEFYYHVQQTSFGPYVDQIARYAGGRRDRLGLQGERQVAAGRRRRGVAEGRRHRALVLGAVRRRGRAEDARARACRRRAEELLPRLRGGRQRRSRTAAVGAVLHVGRSRTVATQGATQAAVGCVGKHRGLVRATLAGAVRSNALA